MTATALELEQHDLKQTAWHEAGHIVVARHFGLHAFARVWRASNPTWEQRSYRGQTHYWHTTKFRHAVIGWAGVIAERLQPGDDYLYAEDLFYDFCSQYMECDTDDLSPTDRESIFGWHQRWRTCKTAHAILTRQHSSLARHAEELIAEAGYTA